MHLLQLAGSQAWPNLLPILALKPTTVTFLTSCSNPAQDYQRSIESIKDACNKAGVSFEIKTISTPSKDPTCDECREVLRNIQPNCINLTGGTKPMSIAAYDLAQCARLPAFYLDTRRKNPVEAINEFSTDIRDRLNQELSSVVSKITVPISLKANGFPVPENFKTPPKHWTIFAVQAAQLRQDPLADQEISKVIGQLRLQLMGTNNTMPKKAQLRNVLQQPISVTIGTFWHRYLLAASDAGVIQSIETAGSGQQEFLLVHEDPVTTPAEKLRSIAIETFKLLEGTWFELALLHYLQKKSSFSDIAWSVEADHHQDANASSRGETDLVAFDTNELKLHFISCKTSGPHGNALDHIQGLRSRATKEGGQFSKAVLWIFRARNANQSKEIQNHCEEQKVDFHVFTDLVDSQIS